VSVTASLWLRLTATTTVAAVLLVTVSPARPDERLPWPAVPVAGAVAGGLLFLLATRRRLRVPAAPGSLPLLVARHGFLGLCAANEEIVWRRVLLGELLPGGAVAALAASTIAFALAHRAHRVLHLGTGAAFGGLYLATGALAASVVAHWTYNALVGALAGGGPHPETPEGSSESVGETVKFPPHAHRAREVAR